MSADREFEAVESCWLLLSPLASAAKQYLEQFEILTKHLATRDLAANLQASGSLEIKPIADKLRGLVDTYFNRFRDFQTAARTAIDALAEFQPFSRTIRELKRKIHGYRSGQIRPTCQVVLQAAHELGTHPFLRQKQQELPPFEVAPLLAEDEIKAIEAQIQEIRKNLSTELGEIHAKKAAEALEHEAERLKQSNATNTVAPDRAGSPVSLGRRKHGPPPDMDRHRKILGVVQPYGAGWKQHLEEIADKLDEQKVSPSRDWANRKPKALSWSRAVAHYPELVVKAIAYSKVKAQ